MMRPPSGTIAVVFTDIQGSTRLWSGAPAAMREALEIHDDLLRATLVDHDGYEVKNEGDAFVLAFADVQRAASWCVAAQRALVGAPWPEALGRLADARQEPGFRGLRVRMGIHVGQPWARTDPVTQRVDYVGHDMNVAARVAAAAHGGQVLLTQEAARALGASSASDLRAMGLYRLRGVADPQRLWTLEVGGMPPRRFPELRATRERRHNLPESPPRLVGREEELGQLVSGLLSGRVRASNLWGRGGVGKTSLALAAASHVADELAGGAWLADLSDAYDVDSAAVVIGQALGLRLDRDAMASLLEVLPERGRLVLVLERIGHLDLCLDQLVSRLLQRAPEVRLLLTSRAAMLAEGAEVRHVLPLACPPSGAGLHEVRSSPAVALFRDRAARVRPGFEVDAENAEDIGEIVRRLEGLPLALELAAARLGTLAPFVLRRRLEQALAGREGGTLPGTVRWSWELLRPWEQAALVQCSVFEGGFDMAAARAVVDLSRWDEAQDTTAVLLDLVDSGLVHVMPSDASRYAPWGVVTEFLKGEDAAGPDRAAAEVRHGAWFAERARELLEPGRGAQGQGVEDLENLLRASERALERSDLGVAWVTLEAALELCALRGPNTEVVTLCDRILVRPDMPPLARARLCFRRGQLFQYLGRTVEATEDLRAARRLAEGAGDLGTAARAWLLLGVQHHDRADTVQAGEFYEVAIDRSREAGDRRTEGRAWSCLANVHRELGDAARARRCFHRAHELATSTRSVRLRAVALCNHALLDLDLGETRVGLEKARSGLSAAREVGDRRLEGVALSLVARARADLGDIDAALELLDMALPVVREADLRLLAGTLAMVGDLRLARDEHDLARAALDEAADLYRRLSARDGHATVQLRLGAILLLSGDPSSGSRCMQEAEQVLWDVGNLFLFVRGRLVRVRALARAGLRFEARSLLDGLAPCLDELQVGEGSGLYEEYAGLRRSLGSASDRVDPTGESAVG